MTSHDDRPFCGDIPRIARRLPGVARRTRGIRVPTPANPPRDPALEQATPARGHRSARDTDTEAAATAARQRMWQFMSRAGSRGVTVTMIVKVLATVERSTVRHWLAEDIQRGVVERVTPGFYSMRQSSDGGNQHRRRGCSDM